MTTDKTSILISGQNAYILKDANGGYINIPLSKVEDVPVETSVYLSQAPTYSITSPGSIPDNVLANTEITIVDGVFKNPGSEEIIEIVWTEKNWYLLDNILSSDILVRTDSLEDDLLPQSAALITGEDSNSITVLEDWVTKYLAFRYFGYDPRNDVEVELLVHIRGPVKIPQDLSFELLTNPTVEIDGDGTVTVGNKVTSIESAEYTINGIDPYEFTENDLRAGWLQYNSDPNATSGWTNILDEYEDYENVTEATIPQIAVGSYLRIRCIAQHPRGTDSIIGTSETFGPVLAEEIDANNFVGNTESYETSWTMFGHRPKSAFDANLPGFKGEQHLVAAARSVSNPELTIFGQDVSSIWLCENSTDEFPRWRHVASVGLEERRTQSVAIHYANDSFWLYSAGDIGGEYSDGHGVYKTTDKGQTFKKVLWRGNGLFKKVHSGSRECTFGSGNGLHRQMRYLFAQHPSNPNIWYWANPGDGLYKSTDAAENWSRITTSQFGENQMGRIFHIILNKDNPNMLYAACEGGFYRCDNLNNNNPTFSKIRNNNDYPNAPTGVSGGVITSGDWFTSIYMYKDNGAHLLGVVAENGVYESYNSGDDWTKVYNDGDAYAVAVHDDVPSHMYLIRTDSKSKYSTNGPTNFQLFNDSDLTNYGIEDYGLGKQNIKANFDNPKISGQWKERSAQVAILPHPSNVNNFMACGNAMFYKWDGPNKRLQDNCLGFDTKGTGHCHQAGDNSGSIAFHPTDPLTWYETHFDTSAVLTENGGSWYVDRGSRISVTSDKAFSVCANFQKNNPNRLITTAGVYDKQGGVQQHNTFFNNPYRASDWFSKIKTPGGDRSKSTEYEMWVAFHNTRTSWGYTSSYRTTDGGQNWETWREANTDNPKTTPNNLVAFAMHPVNGDVLWGFTTHPYQEDGKTKYYEKLWRTDDGGDTWNDYGRFESRLQGKYYRATAISVDYLDDKKVWFKTAAGGVGYRIVNNNNTGWSGPTVSLGQNGTGCKTILVDSYAQQKFGIDIIYALKGSVNGKNVILSRKIGNGSWHDVSYNLPRVDSLKNFCLHPLTGDVFAFGTIGFYAMARPSSVYGALEAHGDINASVMLTLNLVTNWGSL